MKPSEFYRSMIKNYFTSRMYTEEQAKMISKQTYETIQSFLELEKIKTMDEIVNVVSNLRFLPKKTSKL